MEPSALTAHDEFARWASWLVLVAFTAASVWLNAEYARLQGDGLTFHVALPLLALTAGVYAEVVLLSSHRWIVRGVTGTLVVAGFVTMLIGSYIGILGVTQDALPTYGKLNYAVAAFPDAFMLIAATVLMAHRWKKVRGAVATDSDRQPNRLQRLTTKAFDRVESALDKPATPQVNAVTEPVHAPVNAADAVSHNGHSPHPVPDWARSVNTLPTVPTPEPVNAAATDRHVHEALELLDRTGKRVAVETLAAALAALDEGKPIKTISRELGMGERTLREVRDARLPLAHRLANAV